MEQHSDEPAVVTNHTNTIPQLKRSIEGAENTLEKLGEEIEKAKGNDKTYIVKEYKEEVKTTYCEYRRICMGLQKAKNEEDQIAAKLREAEQRASSQRLTELRNEVRTLREKNASLRDKAAEYSVKREKLVAEAQIKEHQSKKIPAQRSVREANGQEGDIKRQITDSVEEIQGKRAANMDVVSELRQIIEDQKQKIATHIQKTDVPQEIKAVPDDL
jgi:uncharacterized phage infection (PIP) family protein YhgE